MKLADFSLLKEDPDAYHVGHPKGKTLRIPKMGLSDLAHKKIKMMASGGSVEEDQETWATKDPVADFRALSGNDRSHLSDKQTDRLDEYLKTADRSPAGASGSWDEPKDDSIFKKAGNLFHNAGTDVIDAVSRVAKPIGNAASEFASGVMGSQAAEAAQPQSASLPVEHYNASSQRSLAAPAQGMDMSGYQQSYNKLMTGVNEQKQAANQEAAATGQLGQQEASLAEQHIKDVQTAQKDYQAQLGQLTNEYKATVADIQKGHINPNHYFESKSTAGKVATAVGLILGGIGGGLTGKENPALSFLNAQMNRDIEAQKSELGKKETLLSANLRQFGNLHQATLMTQAMQAGIYSDQLKAAAAKSMDPMAKARALQVAGQLDQTVVAPAMQQLAQRKVLQNFMGGGGQQQAQPARKVLMMQKLGIMDESTAKKALEEVGKAQDHGRQVQAIIGSFDKSNQENTVVGRASHLGAEPASVAVLQNALMPYLKDAEGRINEMELQRTDKLIPRPGDSPQKVKEKRAGLLRFLQEKSATPTLDAYGVSVAAPNEFHPR